MGFPCSQAENNLLRKNHPFKTPKPSINQLTNFFNMRRVLFSWRAYHYEKAVRAEA